MWAVSIARHPSSTSIAQPPLEPEIDRASHVSRHPLAIPAEAVPAQQIRVGDGDQLLHWAHRASAEVSKNAALAFAMGPRCNKNEPGQTTAPTLVRQNLERILFALRHSHEHMQKS